MNRIRIIGLFAYFHLTSFLVFITRGSPYFVNRKLLIGTVLVALSSLQSCSSKNQTESIPDATDDGSDIINCYAAPGPDDSSNSNGGAGGVDSNGYVPPVLDASDDGNRGSGSIESNDSSTEDDGGSEFDDDSDAGSDD